MSIWTHVNGSVRIDDIRFQYGDNIENIKKCFGNIVNYDDPQEKWDNCTVPCGSEGSIKYEIYENPDISSLSSYRVQIWGDLRDYDDIEEIKNWFQKAISTLIIRSSILEIEVENSNKIIIILGIDDVIEYYFQKKGDK
jgi:hypothetical protein